eukprot:m.166917 g.166917  ORF g.166917 m.166917 type:complete len:101 (+) comp38916_c0_seq35:916-1218(+)
MLKEDKEIDDDILTLLMTTQYKDGRPLTDSEVTGLLIGLLMAGQHTSSTTSSWLGFYLAQHQDVQDKCFGEQEEIGGPHMEAAASLDYGRLHTFLVAKLC